MDRWDAGGAAGAAMVGGGVWSLAGAAWAAILWGSMLVMVYIVREVRLVRARRREEG